MDVFDGARAEDDAQAAFEVLAADGFPVQLEMQWLVSISLLPEVCRYLADAQRAATLYELLRPYAERNALAPQELCRGSVSAAWGSWRGR